MDSQDIEEVLIMHESCRSFFLLRLLDLRLFRRLTRNGSVRTLMKFHVDLGRRSFIFLQKTLKLSCKSYRRPLKKDYQFVLKEELHSN